MSELQYIYGVNSFLSEIHVHAIDFDKTYKTPEYQHVVHIKHIESQNGNGMMEMNIYTDGKLMVFEIGNWRISPIIKMPFNWTGYSDTLEIQDINTKTISHTATPDEDSLYSKKDFIKDIKWVFETIKSFENIENVEHFDLLNHIKETIRVLTIYEKSDVAINTKIPLAPSSCLLITLLLNLCPLTTV